jgi:N-acetyllactosaminide 3-alpha-galactosyltransferase/rhamnosyl/mannosyltransferase
MRVLHLGKLCPPNEGGIEVFSYDLLEYLNSKGIKADLLCFGNRTEKANYKGFDYFECKMNIKLFSAPLSYDFIKVFRRIEKALIDGLYIKQKSKELKHYERQNR